MAAQPGSDMPSASARPFMVEAVPMVFAMADRGGGRGHHIHEGVIVDLARRMLGAGLPHHGAGTGALALPQPFSMGPPDSTMAGMFTVAAAMMQAGVVLSQPVVSTTPSSG